MFTPASKKEAKLRLALTGPSGGGKTWTSLQIATQFGGRIAVVDTERKSASKYADQFRFDVVDIEPPFHPQKYIEAIQEAQRLGYTTIVLDSLTHAWTGTGGILAIVDDIASHSQSQNKFTAWNEGTRLYNDLINAIVQSDIHVIGTIRSKQEHVLERDEKGKNKVVRIGLQPIQRKDFEFEFDLVMAMDVQNNATVTKTRCRDLPMGMMIPKPGVNVAKALMTWLHGVEWIESTSERAVSFASEAWKMHKDETKERIEKEIKEERVSAFLPKDEFKEWVKVMA